MAVNANTYGSVTAVERLVGDIVASRDFTGSTEPTEDDVALELDAAADILNSALEQAGYVAKVATTDTFAFNELVRANDWGAAATVLAMLPTSAYNPDTQEDIGETRPQMYQARFNRTLKRITERKLVATFATRRMSQIFSGSREDADGNIKKPFFTRGMHDFPGSRNLLE